MSKPTLDEIARDAWGVAGCHECAELFPITEGDWLVYDGGRGVYHHLKCPWVIRTEDDETKEG